MRILIVEDDAATAGYLQKGLGESGHVVDHAASGPDGLAMAAGGGYDVLIVDRMLPGLDGLALISALRDRGLATPVLILSALSKVDDRVQGLRAGGDDYLTKPFAFSELLEKGRARTREGEAADFREHLRLYRFLVERQWVYGEAEFTANPQNLFVLLISEEGLYHSLQKVSFSAWVPRAAVGEADYTPELAQLGCIPVLQRAGYRCDWLKAASTEFANSIFHAPESGPVATGCRWPRW